MLVFCWNLLPPYETVLPLTLTLSKSLTTHTLAVFTTLMRRWSVTILFGPANSRHVNLFSPLWWCWQGTKDSSASFAVHLSLCLSLVCLTQLGSAPHALSVSFLPATHSAVKLCLAKVRLKFNYLLCLIKARRRKCITLYGCNVSSQTHI